MALLLFSTSFKLKHVLLLPGNNTYATVRVPGVHFKIKMGGHGQRSQRPIRSKDETRSEAFSVSNSSITLLALAGHEPTADTYFSVLQIFKST